MIDLKIERQAIYKSFKEKPGICPQCGGGLNKAFYLTWSPARPAGGKPIYSL